MRQVLSSIRLRWSVTVGGQQIGNAAETQGKIAEIGTHDELLAKEGGIYAKLVEMQIIKMHENFISED